MEKILLYASLFCGATPHGMTYCTPYPAAKRIQDYFAQKLALAQNYIGELLRIMLRMSGCVQPLPPVASKGFILRISAIAIEIAKAVTLMHVGSEAKPTPNRYILRNMVESPYGYLIYQFCVYDSRGCTTNCLPKM
jgi:hypothetical protein